MSNTIAQTLTDIFAKYRNVDLNNEDQKREFANFILASNIPGYHKDVLITVLLGKNILEIVCNLNGVKNTENLRHSQAMMEIESRAFEALLVKNRHIS